MPNRLEQLRVICSTCQRMGLRAERMIPRNVAGLVRSTFLVMLSLFVAISSLGIAKRAPASVAMAAAPVEALAVVSASELDLARERYFHSEVPYGRLIYREAMRNGLEPELVAAIIRAESNFQSHRVSERNATGLMQVIPSTGLDLGVTNLTNPAENVSAGTRHLKRLHDQFGGDVTLTLAAYNAGEGTVRRYDGVPPYRETREYVARVSRYREHFHRAVSEAAASQRVSDVAAR